jgi:PilZ domain-containing protein
MGRALDLSEGGLFMHTVAPVTVGGRINLSIDLAPGQAVRAVAVVLRRDDTRDGFGLKFVELPPAAWRAIKEFVAAASPS